MILDLTFATGAPASFEDPILAAAAVLGAAILNPITVTIDVGYGTYDGTPIPASDISLGGITQSFAGPDGTFLAPAQALALGMDPNLAVDGYVGFQSDAPNLEALALNELTHALGRLTWGNGPMTLFDYTAPGVLFGGAGSSTTLATYMSEDDGKTDLANFATTDDTQFAPDGGDPFSIDPTQTTLTPLDLVELNLLGYNIGPVPGLVGTPKVIDANLVFATPDGTVPVWGINGGYDVANGAAPNAPPGWKIADATGDFSGNASSDDILWQTSAGQVAIWEMSDVQLTGAAYTTDGGSIVGVPAPGWLILGVADFFGQGDNDILWQTGGGSPAIWEMSGTQVTAASYTTLNGSVVGAPDPSWHIIGAGDFTGTGEDGILWRTDSGALAIWEMNGFQITSAAYLTDGGKQVGVPGPDWHMITTGDFTGNGMDDLLWETDSGALALWEMDGSQIVGAQYLTDNGASVGVPAPGWTIKGAADIDGSGRDSILWQTPGGEVAVWQMNGPQVTGAAYLANAPGMADGSIAMHSYSVI